MKALNGMLLIAAMAFAMTSCSNDDEVPGGQTNNVDTNKITYNVAGSALSRAATNYDAANLPDSFYAWAYYNDGSSDYTYFEADEVALAANGTGYLGTGTQYWPDNYALNVYALAGTNENFSWTKTVGSNTIINPNFSYTVDTDAANQKDILYAEAVNQTKAANQQSGITLNFRHAMSQIAFRAKVKHQSLKVEITEIAIHNVNSTGVFTFPVYSGTKYSTTPQVTDTYTTDSNSIGEWANRSYDSTNGNSYALSFDANNATPTVLAAGDSIAADDVMMLIPDNYINRAWTGETATTGTNWKAGYVYFTIKCKITQTGGKNIATGEAKDIELWNTATSGKQVYVPANVSWEQGRKYTYTFIFDNDGTGGKDGDGDDPTKPVLFKVTYNTTVDNWVDAGNTDINV
jgi:hypothetical protein